MYSIAANFLNSHANHCILNFSAEILCFTIRSSWVISATQMFERIHCIFVFNVRFVINFPAESNAMFNDFTEILIAMFHRRESFS